jgi:hypothetical protein
MDLAFPYNSRMSRASSVCRIWKLWLLAVCLLLCECGVAQQTPGGVEPLEIQTTTLPKAGVRQPYHFQLKAQGGTPPLKWEITGGTHPDGLTLGEDGVLSGAPLQRGEFHLGITVTDNAQPPQQRNRGLVLLVVAPLSVEWGRSAAVVGQRIEGSVKVSNETEQDFDLTVVVVAVNGDGRATALGYQRFILAKDTTDFEIPFGEHLPPGTYQVNADAVGEVAATNSIYRTRLVSDGLHIQPEP